MIAFLDNLFPWFGDMLALGGAVLVVIFFLAAIMWTLILERLVFLFLIFPRQAATAQTYWVNRHDHHTWFAQQFRGRLLLHLKWNLERNLPFIKTLIKVCPLLGLLGTVMGMLEVFDGMAATGNNSPKSTAAGVSKATVSTMAGMVVAISGLLISIVLERRVSRESQQVSQCLEYSSDREM